MTEPQQISEHDWFDATQQAIAALESAESGAALRGAPWWTVLLSALQTVKKDAGDLRITVLIQLTEKILENMQPLHDGIVNLAPGTLKLLGRSLRKWESLRDQLAAFPIDDELSTLLHGLGSENLEQKPTPGRSTIFIADMEKYLPLFVEEAEEGLETMQSSLLQLESAVKGGQIPGQAVIDELFRHAHKIKASASAMGFAALSETTHTLETVLDRIRSFQLRATPDVVTTMLTTLDSLQAEVETAKRGEVPTGDLLEAKAALMWFLDAAPVLPQTMRPLDPDPPAPSAAPAGPQAPLPEAELEKLNVAMDEGLNAFRISLKVRPESPLPEVRLLLALKRVQEVGMIVSSTPAAELLETQPGISVLTLVVTSKEKEDKVRLQIRDEEMEILSVEPMKAPTQEAGAAAAATAAQSIKVPVLRLDELMNLSGELSISKNNFINVSQKVRRSAGEKVSQAFEDAIAQLSTLANGIQQIVLELRMVPISPLFERCRRVVRDIAHELGKEVELVLHGAETSLDKKIINQLGDPLNHMMRNAVDHGLESPSERIAAGKPAFGTISIKAEREGSMICVVIKDDGRGLGVEEIRKKAVELALVSNENAAKLTPTELFQYIFHAGFSTARSVTPISGRGVGMDIVRKRIDEVNGTIRVDSTPGHGTEFRITLPLTVVSQDCLLFDIHGVSFAFPLHSVAEILRVPTQDLLEMKFGKFVRLRDEMVPVFRIKHFFRNTHFKKASNDSAQTNVVIVRAGQRRIGLIVDELRGEEEILMKHPGSLVGEIPGISGVSVLSTGTVALILDVEKLIERSIAEGRPIEGEAAAVANS